MSDIQTSLFGKLAIQTGLVSQAQIEECLLIQEAAKQQGKKIPRLGELLAHKGILTPEQVKKLLRQQHTDAAASAPSTVGASKSTKNTTSKDAFSETTLFDTNEEEVVAEFGRFRLLERLGSDADGMTFKAKTPDNEEPLILRTIAPKLSRDGDFARRFTEQAKKASQLKHANIARVLSAGKVDQQFYYTAEFVEGKSLRRLMNRFGAMEPEQVLQMGIGVAEALEAGHARGIFHQHLRPSYILLKEDNTVSVSGFGILPDPIRELKQLVATIGETPFYIAPEQASGIGDADARTDIYALGAILYHALSGQPPFYGDSVEEVLVHIAEDDVPAISIINPSVPPDLEEVIHGMIAPNPEDRPQNATRLIEQLKAAKDVLDGVGAPHKKGTTRRLNHINRHAKAAEAVQENNVVAVKRMGLTKRSLNRVKSERAKRYVRKENPNYALIGFFIFLGVVAAGFLVSTILDGMEQKKQDEAMKGKIPVKFFDPISKTEITKWMTEAEIELHQKNVEEQRKKEKAEIDERKKRESEKKALEKEKAKLEEQQKQLAEKTKELEKTTATQNGADGSEKKPATFEIITENSFLKKNEGNDSPLFREKMKAIEDAVHDRSDD